MIAKFDERNNQKIDDGKSFDNLMPLASILRNIYNSLGSTKTIIDVW